MILGRKKVAGSIPAVSTKALVNEYVSKSFLLGANVTHETGIVLMYRISGHTRSDHAP